MLFQQRIHPHFSILLELVKYCLPVRYRECWTLLGVTPEGLYFDCLVLACDRHLVLKGASIIFCCKLGYHKRLLLRVVAHEDDSGACREIQFLFSKNSHNVVRESLRLSIEISFIPKVVLCFNKLELCLAFLMFILVDLSCEVAEVSDSRGLVLASPRDTADYVMSQLLHIIHVRNAHTHMTDLLVLLEALFVLKKNSF